MIERWKIMLRFHISSTPDRIAYLFIAVEQHLPFLSLSLSLSFISEWMKSRIAYNLTQISATHQPCVFAVNPVDDGSISSTDDGDVHLWARE